MSSQLLKITQLGRDEAGITKPIRSNGLEGGVWLQLCPELLCDFGGSSVLISPSAFSSLRDALR